MAAASEILKDVFTRASRKGALQLPMPVLASRHCTPVVRDYLIWWITNPNPAGTFAARTRWVRWLPGSLLIRALFAMGYDGLVYLKDDVVVGHGFFQRRGAALHGFSTCVSEPFAGHGYSVMIMLDYVTYASRVPGIVKARVGRGRNSVTLRFLQRLKKHEPQLDWRVDLDGWVTFRRETRNGT